MGLKLKDNAVQRTAVENENVAVEAVAAESVAATPEVNDGVLNSKVSTLEFVAPLGDPSKDDTTTIKGTTDKKVTAFIVGYRFRSSEPIDVPWCETTPAFKTNPMDFKDINGSRHFEPGEEFDLTPFETAMLLSRPEYNARATGGGREVVLAYVNKAAKNKAGEVVKNTDAQEFPRAVLKTTEGSIKDFNIINVLDFTVEKTDTGVTRKKRTIIPGFEKWQPRCVSAVRSLGGASRSSKSGKEQYNESAARFLMLARKKGYKG